MLTQLLLFILSLFLVGISSEILISLLVKLSKMFGWSYEFIGLSILSIGTSIPEISSHIAGSLLILEGKNINEVSDIVISTNIGSNIIQITLILGIVGLFMKVTTSKKFLKRDYLFMLLGILGLFFFGLDGLINRFEAAFLFFIYIAYLLFIYFNDYNNKTKKSINRENFSIKEKLFTLFFSFLFIALLLFSAFLLVNSSTSLVELLHIKGTILGALIIGIGTAIPELATAISSIRHHAKGIGLGVLIGSNITNPLMAIGLGAMISTYTMNKSLLFFDIPFWFFSSLLILFFLRKGYELYKREAIVMLFLYFLYISLKLFVV